MMMTITTSPPVNDDESLAWNAGADDLLTNSLKSNFVAIEEHENKKKMKMKRQN